MGVFQFIKKEKKEDRKEKASLNSRFRGNGIKKEKLVDDNQKPEVKLAGENKIDKTVNLEKSGGKQNDLPLKKQSEIAYRVLSAPWITERSHNLMALNKYVFKVTMFSSKSQIKQAVEELYGVKVIKINIINIPPKKRNFARKAGWKSGYKKAVVTLKEGDKIEMFQSA